MRRFLSLLVGTAALAFVSGCENSAVVSPPTTGRVAAGSAVRNTTESVTSGDITLTNLGVMQPNGYAWATAINNSGTIVGTTGPFHACCSEFVQVEHGFVWDPTTQLMRDLGVSTLDYAGGIDGSAAAISANGWIAGSGRSNYWSWQVAFHIVDPTTHILTDLRYAPNGATCCWLRNFAQGINSSRFIVGYSNEFGDSRAFLWDGAALLNDPAHVPGSHVYELAPLDASGPAKATAINEAGLIVGEGFAAGVLHPVSWDVSTRLPRDLGLPAAWKGAVAAAINADGYIAGYGSDASGAQRGFLWNPTSHQFTEIGGLPGGGTQVFGLNASRNAVGSSHTLAGRKHAFAWEAATNRVTDLGTWPGDVESDARGINDNNDAVGSSTGAQSRAIRWHIAFTPPDNTPPIITPTITGTHGSNGWYVSNVAVSWSVTDAESAVSASSGCGASAVISDISGVTFTCTATSAGGTGSQSVIVKRDATPPTIDFAGNLGSYTVDQSVSVTCAASDAMSGLASNSCANTSADAYTFGVGSHSLSASASDWAGNGVNASATFSVTVSAGSLCSLVRRWVDQAGIANSMCQQLNNGAFGAFRNHLSAQSGKSVTAAHSAILSSLSSSL